jgi:hypothetical protein
MRNYRKITGAHFLAACILFITACNGTEKSKKTTESSSTTVTVKDSSGGDTINGGKNPADTTSSRTRSKENSAASVKKDRTYNDIARLLAGLPQEDGSTLDSLQKTPTWESHADNFNKTWASISRRRLMPMANWSSKELKDINANGNDMFYPFSGPDFMNMYTFFPDAKTYTMLALEKPGFLPHADKFKEEELNTYLESVQKSLKDIFILSFFVTKNMQKDLVKNKVNGALPLISIFIVRTGNTILNIERVRIAADGKVVTMSNDSNIRAINTGARITFKPKDGDDVRTVYYFSSDISDDGLSRNPGMVKYLADMGHVNSYLKSASYLLHYDHFSKFRDALLDKSDHVLQDDAGVAYRYFKKDIWDIQLYGKWVKPIPLFHKMEQPDLKEAYLRDSAKVRPIPFSIGYNFSSKDSPILLLANKKK